MAVLIAKASGLLTASTSWGTAASASNSYLNAENGSEVLTTAYSDTRSSAFTPGAVTIDAIAVKLSVRTGVTGTISVHLILSADNSEVAGTEVTINVADLPVSATADLNGGWILFKLAAPVLLVVAVAYKIEAKTSDASQVSLFRDATADNLSRALRTTTEAAPGAGDDMIIAGEKTGAGAETAITVTMDSEAATDYGAASTSLITPSLAICDGGTLQFGTTAATNYILRQSGNVVVYSGGTFNIGTTGTPIPRGGSAVLEFDCAADGGFGMTVRNEATFNAQGLSRTAAKLIDRCLLNTDEAVNSTSLGVSEDTGWLDNDEIVVASTSQTNTESEKGALNGAAGASSLTVDGFAGAGGGLAAAHSGTSPTQARVILLTRNVRIRSVTATLMTYCNFQPTSIADIDWAEFYYVGENATNQRGVDVQTTTGSFNMQRCSIHDCEDFGFHVSGSATDNIVFSNNVCWNLCTIQTSAGGVHIAAATTGTITTSGNIVIRTVGASSRCFNFADVGGIITDNVAISAAADGFVLTESAALGTFSGNTAHSCGDDGIQITGTMPGGGSIDDFTAWRCVTSGMSLSGVINNLTFDGGVLFGNGTNNINLPGRLYYVDFKDYVLNGDSTFATANGITTALNQIGVKLIDCDFSTAGGIKTAHTNDFNITANALVQIVNLNSKFGAATYINGMSGALPGSYIRSQKHQQTAANHRSDEPYGTIALDATTFHAAAPSEKLTPLSASSKLESGVKKYAVANGGTVTASVWVLKDATYNGNAPRLILKANPAAGIAADVVLDTHAAAVDTWEQLSGTSAAVTDDAVLSVVVDCDGTAGSVFCDDYGT